MNVPQDALDAIARAEAEGRVTEHRKSPEASEPFIFTLPWPPSVNHYWRHVDNKVLISSEGRSYRKRVREQFWVDSRPTFLGRLSVRLVFCSPDRRKRDLDNLCKSLLDALQAVGFYDDDSQIDELTLVRGGVDASGRGFVLVRLAAIGVAQET